MSSESPFLPTQPNASSQQDDVWDFAEICIQQTAELITQARAATPTELIHAIAKIRENHAQQIPDDLLDGLARIQGHDEEHISEAIHNLSNRIASMLDISTPIIPFAAKIMAPNIFYEKYSRIHKIAKILLTPVIYAEDTDAIGIASTNPIACLILSEEITSQVFKQSGINPFISIIRLDYENWVFLTRKHFGL